MSHTFRGRTLTEARHTAEEALGGDVVVLELKRVKRDGIAGALGATEFEIEAGLQLPDLPAPPKPTLPAAPAAPAAPERTLRFAAAAYDDEAPRKAQISELQKEVRAMRALLYRMQSSPNRVETELKSLRRAVGSMSPRAGGKGQVARWLESAGLDGPLARTVGSALRNHRGSVDKLYDTFRDALAEHIKVAKWPLADEGKRVVAVVGPPGVGKTTTLAKLAAHAVADGNTIAFITTDTFRVGGIEHLARYAKLLDAPIAVAHSDHEVHHAINSTDADVVFVDTAGQNPEGDAAPECALAEPRGWGDRSRHVLLCLDASLRSADAEAMVSRYESCDPTAIAITKLDLTAAPGGLVLGTAVSELPVSTLSDGQNVPDDVSPATAGRLLDRLAPATGQN